MPRITKREVNEAAGEYNHLMQTTGLQNMATQRAEFKYRDLQKKWDEQKERQKEKMNKGYKVWAQNTSVNIEIGGKISTLVKAKKEAISYINEYGQGKQAKKEARNAVRQLTKEDLIDGHWNIDYC